MFQASHKFAPFPFFFIGLSIIFMNDRSYSPCTFLEIAYPPLLISPLLEYGCLSPSSPLVPAYLRVAAGAIGRTEWSCHQH